MSAKTDYKLNLAPFFQQVLDQLKEEVDKLPIEQVQSEGSVDRLVKKFILPTFSLEKDTTHVSIRERAYRKGEAPEGKVVEKGEKLQIAHFRVHVKGSKSALKWVMEQSGLAANGLTVLSGHLVYEHPSFEGAIESSETRLKKIREAAKKRFEEVEVMFGQFDAKAQAFNADLPQKIKPFIEKKLAHMEALKQAEQKLNPFA
jgi:hypothetical protein